MASQYPSSSLSSSLQHGNSYSPGSNISSVVRKDPHFTHSHVQSIPFFSSSGLVIVGYADKFGVRDYSGFLIAIWSLGSGIAALISGTIVWRRSEKTRFLFFLISLLILTLPIYLVVHIFPGNHLAMSIALFFNGLAIAPMLTAGFTVAEKSVSEKRTTEVLAWTISALNLGGALPTALTGYIIDNYGVTVAFAIPVGCMLLSVLSLLPFANYWQGKVGASA